MKFYDYEICLDLLFVCWIFLMIFVYYLNIEQLFNVSFVGFDISSFVRFKLWRKPSCEEMVPSSPSSHDIQSSLTNLRELFHWVNNICSLRRMPLRWNNEAILVGG